MLTYMASVLKDIFTVRDGEDKIRRVSDTTVSEDVLVQFCRQSGN